MTVKYLEEIKLYVARYVALLHLLPFPSVLISKYFVMGLLPSPELILMVGIPDTQVVKSKFLGRVLGNLSKTLCRGRLCFVSGCLWLRGIPPNKLSFCVLSAYVLFV